MVISGRLEGAMDIVRKVAHVNISVLITGESGTGKEVIARALHWHSDRRSRAFVPFNCTAVPRDLIESHLFGYRRGAFTGADKDSPGLVRAARDGTLFLDEIGDLGLDVQPKLLRFLESGEIHPLGEPMPLSVDVRVVAATNANLNELIRHGRFREDLFYRLNVIVIPLPPLRERRDEIPGLLAHFIGKASEEFGKGHVQFGADVLEHVLLYEWPGNIRQLYNEVRRMVALADADTTLHADALSPCIRHAPPERVLSTDADHVTVSLRAKLPSTIEAVEREMIKAALTSHGGHVEETARALGISRKGLYLKRQRLGL